MGIIDPMVFGSAAANGILEFDARLIFGVLGAVLLALGAVGALRVAPSRWRVRRAPAAAAQGLGLVAARTK